MTNIPPLPTANDVGLPARDAVDRLSLLSVILLGLGAVLTAFAAFQSGLMGSQLLDAYTRSSQYTTTASDLGTQGDVMQSSSELLFLEWSKATVTGDEEFADYIVDTLMLDEQWEAVQWWIEHGDASGPFVDDNEAWTNPWWDEAEEFEVAAQEAYAEAVWASRRGDTFQLSTVFYAVTLFFAGLANAFDDRRIRIAALGISAAALLGGSGVMLHAHLQ